jgi:hypothetical protein
MLQIRVNIKRPHSPLEQGRRQNFESGVVFSKIPDFHGQFQRFFPKDSFL